MSTFHSAGTSERSNSAPLIDQVSGAVLSLVLALSLSVGLTSCGYRFTPNGGDFPNGIETAFVPTFKNDTAEAGLGAWCTDALRQELARRNKDGGELSDGIIEGRILEIKDPTAIYTTDQSGNIRRTSARVSAVIEVKLIRRKNGEVIRSFKVRGSEDYLVSKARGSMAVMEDDSNRRQALKRLSVTLMMEASERLQTF